MMKWGTFLIVTGVCALCGWVSPRLPMKAPQHIVDAAARGAKMINKLILIGREHTLIPDLDYESACKLLSRISNSKANMYCQFFLKGKGLGEGWDVCYRNHAETEAFLADPEAFVIQVP